jgi:hypothetical protein
MTVSTSQYVRVLSFSNSVPDEKSWERHLVEIGLDREAFHISNGDGAATLKFWEPDRVEALRVLARLDRLQ